MAVGPTALMDTPASVAVKGLPAGRDVTITSAATDKSGVKWTASASFVVPPNGVVSLTSSSTGGSYRGVDPMGLFDLMTPPASNHSDTIFEPPAGGFTVSLNASIAGKNVASASMQRTLPAGALHPSTPSLAANGVDGQLFLPTAASGTHPAVLVFGGSEGGLSAVVTLQATLIAEHGYPTLAVAYFGAPGLPSALSQIPLEYFTKALTILRSQPGVDPHHVLVEGTSRGTEAALLLAANFPGLVNGVIAGAPSSVANPSYPTLTDAAWTLGGQPVATVGKGEIGLATPPDFPASVIPVEKIQGPVLLACGQDDRVWPSCAYSQAITARLHAHAFRYPITALTYPDAGHAIGVMTAFYSATAQAFSADGGTVTGNATALGASHTALLAFLAQQ